MKVDGVGHFDIKISVDKLKVGMFVCGLDRDWLETPFLMQGFLIESLEDIQKVSEYCESVYVLGKDFLGFDTPVDFTSGVLIGRKPVEYFPSTTFDKEYPQAEKLSKKLLGYVVGMLDNVRKGQLIDTSLAKSIVEECVDSVIRHPDVLMFMSKLRGNDEYTVEHCMNVCMLAIVFGRKLGLRKKQLVNLGLCGLLHDAGKAKVPNAILNKPGRLTDDEYHIMKNHTVLGKEILSEKKNMYIQAIEVAYSHHERPDGLGYPNGIGKDRLSLFTKIISIVDAYDAITGNRVYEKGRSSIEALSIIYEQRGKQFDNDLSLAFIQTVGIYPSGLIVELRNGMIAIVTDADGCPRHLPGIMVVLDSNKETVSPFYIKLSHEVYSEQGKSFLIRKVLVDGAHGIYLRNYKNSNAFSNFNLDG